MANKTNQDRTRRIRTVILSASLLSFIPLVGVMQQGESSSQGVALTASEPVTAAQLVSYSTGTMSATAQAAAVATPLATVETSATAAQTVAAESKATTTAQATPASSYTRTKAS